MTVAALNDRKRMETGILATLVFWALMLGGLSFVKFRGPLPPEDSLNPLYIELAQIESAPPPPAPSPDVGGRVQPQPAAETRDAAPSARSSAAAPVAQARPAVPATAPASAPAQLRADPSLPPSPRAPARTPSALQGGSDPFAPLSERSLAAEDPAAPAATPAPAARSDLQAGPSTAAAGGPPVPDAFDRALSSAADRLSTAPSGGSSPGASSAAPYGNEGLPGAASSAAGDFDFGDGAVRRLLTPPGISIPPRLLEGQPRDLYTRVGFRIAPGGTVLTSSIRFDPPLPMDLSDFLRNAFARWQFSPASSDGQVAFMYSIKVR